MVECHLAKVKVASPNLVSRSTFYSCLNGGSFFIAKVTMFYAVTDKELPARIFMRNSKLDKTIEAAPFRDSLMKDQIVR